MLIQDLVFINMVAYTTADGGLQLWSLAGTSSQMTEQLQEHVNSVYAAGKRILKWANKTIVMTLEGTLEKKQKANLEIVASGLVNDVIRGKDKEKFG